MRKAIAATGQTDWQAEHAVQPSGSPSAAEPPSVTAMRPYGQTGTHAPHPVQTVLSIEMEPKGIR